MCRVQHPNIFAHGQLRLIHRNANVKLPLLIAPKAKLGVQYALRFTTANAVLVLCIWLHVAPQGVGCQHIICGVGRHSQSIGSAQHWQIQYIGCHANRYSAIVAQQSSLQCSCLNGAKR